MPRSRTLPLALLAALAAAAPAAARSFIVSKTGNRPALAVDPAGTTHIVWDSVSGDETSTTSYCRVARKAGTCAAGSIRTFTPLAGDQDFAGPRIAVQDKGRRVIIVTSRCCTSGDGADGQAHGTHVLSYVSTDGGRTFAAPAWVGHARARAGLRVRPAGPALVASACSATGPACSRCRWPASRARPPP